MEKDEIKRQQYSVTLDPDLVEQFASAVSWTSGMSVPFNRGIEAAMRLYIASQHSFKAQKR